MKIQTARGPHARSSHRVQGSCRLHPPPPQGCPIGQTRVAPCPASPGSTALLRVPRSLPPRSAAPQPLRLRFHPCVLSAATTGSSPRSWLPCSLTRSSPPPAYSPTYPHLSQGEFHTYLSQTLALVGPCNSQRLLCNKPPQTVASSHNHLCSLTFLQEGVGRQLVLLGLCPGSCLRNHPPPPPEAAGGTHQHFPSLPAALAGELVAHRIPRGQPWGKGRSLNTTTARWGN